MTATASSPTNDVPPPFEFNTEMLDLRAVVGDFCAKHSPEAVVRETMETDTGVDLALWRRLGTELGVLGVAVPTEYDGEGASLIYEAVVMEQLGAALLCGPILGTLCLAIPALVAVSDAWARKEYLPGLITGERVAALVAPLTDTDVSPAAVSVEAALQGDGWQLTGSASFVPDGTLADVLIVAARSPDGVALFAVDSNASGLERSALATMDLTRRQARLSFAATPARLIAAPGEASDVIGRALLVGGALLAVEQVGVAQRMLDVTVEHARTRLQFGQPIGAFQAVKHRCADMLVAVEQARTAAYHAVWALEDGSDDPRLAVSMARAVASEKAAYVCGSAIQMHGASGFAWEGSPQLYLKRATTDGLVMGSVERHVENVARAVLDPLSTSERISSAEEAIR